MALWCVITLNRTNVFVRVFVAPTVTWKPTPSNIIGVSLNLAYQRFKALGIQNFEQASYSSAPGHVTNKGYDHAYGAGLHIGWIGQVNDVVTLGASYQSKTYMSKFDKYQGLFAEGGNSIPTNFGAGEANLKMYQDAPGVAYGWKI